jgi:hypothetical protein
MWPWILIHGKGLIYRDQLCLRCQQGSAQRPDQLRIFGDEYGALQFFGQKGDHAGVLGNAASENNISL